MRSAAGLWDGQAGQLPKGRETYLRVFHFIRICYYFHEGAYVLHGVCLSVYLFVSVKTTYRIFVNILQRLCRRTRKSPLDFGGNPDHITLGLGLQLLRRRFALWECSSL